MAATSTNKQPLLIDRPLHALATISSQKTGNTGYWLSNNSCSVLVDCTQNDGALIEDLYVIAREATSHKISFFMSNTTDVLRESDTTNVVYVTQVASGTTPGAIVHAENLPFGVAPYPTVPLMQYGDVTTTTNTREAGQFKSLYIPKGKVLWVGRAVAATTANLDFATAPVVGAQGGFY